MALATVPELRCVIEDATRGFLHNFFQRRFFEFSARYQFIEIINAGLVKLAIVVFQCLGRNTGSQFILGIR
jgi:hypothetical protein